MENHNIKPEKITKPIQLLAVWLIGLILLVSALIAAAGTIKDPKWLPIFFSISAVCIIPLFLILIFLLQTRFRPQMQEDEYYSKFLNKNTLEIESRLHDKSVDITIQKLEDRIIELSSITKEQIIQLNDTVSEIIKKPNIVNDKTLYDKKIIEIKSFDQFIQDTSINIQVNVQLDFFNEIVTLLKQLDYKIDNFFGKGINHEKPLLFLLSFGNNVNHTVLKKLILELHKFGLTHLKVTDSNTYSNSVYIGSYSYKSGGHVAIKPSLLEEVELSNSTIEIITAIKK